MQPLTGRLATAVVAAAAVALACACTSASAQEKLFNISSTTFKDGGALPAKVGNSQVNDPQNPNCLGQNVSPQLSWVNPPAGTKSFAFLMIDPEGHAGGGVIHWVAYGIPASVTGFAEGEVSKDSPKYVGGKSRMGVGHFSGPCMPPDSSPRHYTFVLVATDLEPDALPGGLTKDQLTLRLAPEKGPRHDLRETGMIGIYARPAP